MSERPAAIVLAGGGSRRMGRDKATLALDGQPLLVHVLALLAGRCAPIVIAARPGQSLPALAGVETLRVDDPVADAGPLVGLARALALVEERGIAEAYLSSCDAAGLSDAHLRFMLERLAQARAEGREGGEGGVIAAVPIDAEGRRHPLASAVVVAPMRARAEAALAAGIARLQVLFEAGSGPGRGPDADGSIVEIPVDELPDAQALAPCNTPDEWAAWRERALTRATRPG